MHLVFWVVVVMGLFFINPSAISLDPAVPRSAYSFNVHSWHLKVLVHSHSSHGVLVNFWCSDDMPENSILLIHNLLTKLYQFFWVVEVVCRNEFLPADVYIRSFVVYDVDFVVYFLIRDPRVIRMFHF